MPTTQRKLVLPCPIVVITVISLVLIQGSMEYTTGAATTTFKDWGRDKDAVNLSPHPILVVFSFDGFRYDYLQRGLNPVMRKMALEGTTTPYLNNQFPTKTFVNHFSLATGMYPETHGVIGNNVFNGRNECVGYSNELFHYNENIIPIWTLNEKAGDGRHSGVMMWPGCEYSYAGGINATFEASYQMYKNMTWQKRVDLIVSWLTHEITPANLIMQYFEQPDEKSHQYGPDSRVVDEQLRRVDLILQYFLDSLDGLRIRDQVNVIVCSDHGFVQLDALTGHNLVLNLNDYLEPDTYTVCDKSPVFHILSKPGFEQEHLDNLTRGEIAFNEITNTKGNKQFSVYTTKNIPQRWHVNNTDRFATLTIVTETPYVFEDSAEMKGTHGFDNINPEMHAIFICQGPLFQRNHTVPPFSNIDIYPLIAHIMSLPPQPANLSPNGSLYSSTIKYVLQRPVENSAEPTTYSKSHCITPSAPYLEIMFLTALYYQKQKSQKL